MNVLLDDEEAEIKKAAARFLALECSPLVARQAEQGPHSYARELWRKLAELGWIGLCLPEDCGGQGLPLIYLGLLLEEVGYHIAPLPLHATTITAVIIARHGNNEQRAMLRNVVSGSLILSYAIQEENGCWGPEHVTMRARLEGGDLILSGTKFFVDAFRISQRCLVVAKLDSGELTTVIVDPESVGIVCEELITLAKDSYQVVHFNEVRVPASAIVGKPGGRYAPVLELMDLASVFMASQMQGAARRAMEVSIEYVNQRQAFEQPVGAFQAIQHMAADMVNAVDGTQLLSREAIWRISEGLPSEMEVSQAKSFANEHCLMVCRSAQQMHGGIGFIADCDINLWYRRVASWSMRCGSTYDHRQRIARGIFNAPVGLRLGDTVTIPPLEHAR